MNILGFLYLALAVGFLILVGFFSYAAYKMAKTFDSIKNVTDDIGSVTSDIALAENQARSLIVSVFKSFLGKG